MVQTAQPEPPLFPRPLLPVGKLSYVLPDDPLPLRAAVRVMERLSGSGKLEKLYRRWRVEKYARGAPFWESALEMLGVDLRLHGAPWPPAVAEDEPRIIIANHPFGLMDGVAAAALAERLGRPFKVMVHEALMRVPEPEPYLLPVDFSESREAMQKNLQLRKDTLAALARGETIVIFPAGGVSTAPKVLGPAEDLPWKRFTARLIREARATVLPLYFPGQNGLMFHAVSKISMRLRISMIVGAAKRHMNRPIDICIGDPIRYDELEALAGNRDALMDVLRAKVYGLSSTMGSNDP
ncbi:glycerol acyltransferase [Rhodospirillaceae bacterium KN72]|uniref:Glycerol acyltransferase n=1 Tax=Pacificispira spongiicola TaxID=2729598 RepID=A0A7Y0DZT1_9PROT|nr:lysophospholipid acyltransferase family protein [Pacificispira spongiicola]NMM44610.1 glycerol acyltransferase [Pacificispira spongiicola]